MPVTLIGTVLGARNTAVSKTRVAGGSLAKSIRCKKEKHHIQNRRGEGQETGMDTGKEVVLGCN